MRAWAGRSGALALVMAVALACVPGAARGLDFGDVSTVAKRVVGGGAECPLRFDRDLLMPSGASSDSIIVPLRVAGNASRGTIGADKPESSLGKRRGIQVDCWFRIGTLQVDVALVAVREGKALAQLATRLEQHSESTPAEIATFISVNAQLQPNDAVAVPGKGSVAFTQVSSVDCDLGLLVAYHPIDGKGTPPDARELERISSALARDLAS